MEANRMRRYMAGDVIRVELDLEHRMNLSRVFAAFSHETDHLTEFFFETTDLPVSEGDPNGSKTTNVMLETRVPPEAKPGVYNLTRVNVFSVSGKLARLREERLEKFSGAHFEVIEEPSEMPNVVGLSLLD
ncbi:MAG: hypothetical protein ACRDSJ_15770 [Rubrobacteraceae bacterium]